MCSSVRTIASLSFHAATRIVTDGHSPFGPVALGRLEREFLVSRDQEREDHEADDEAGDVGEEERNHPGHDRADRGLKLISPWLGHPDAERNPGERQCERDREANGRPKTRDRSFAPRETTESSAVADGWIRIPIGDGDLVIDRGQVRRRGSSWAASSKRRREPRSSPSPRRADDRRRRTAGGAGRPGRS